MIKLNNKILKIIFSSFIFFIFVTQAQTKKISFSVKGLVTVAKENVLIETEWDEKWFGKVDSAVYNHGLARIAGIFSCASYEDFKEKKDSKILLGCYRRLGFPEEKIFTHYDLNYKNSIWANDQSAFSFASKRIESSKGNKTLIFITIRGTPLSANEWISNLNVSDKTKTEAEFHEGFLKSTKQLENAFITYILKNKIELDDCFLFITGHSRGAAIANLFAAGLCDSEFFSTKNIYVYTFASPNVTTNDDVKNSKYNYIWNIVNAEDIVPTSPPNLKNWNYKKYGQVKVLVNAWNCDSSYYEDSLLKKMNSYMNKFMGRNYSPFRTGSFLPIEADEIFSTLNQNVSAYYMGLRALHPRAEKAFWKIFPEQEKTKDSGKNDGASDKSKIANNTVQLNENKKAAGELSDDAKNKNAPLDAEKTDDKPFYETGFIMKFATNLIFREFGLEPQFLINSFVDMHSMETYLSWILALDESEAYSTQGLDLILIRGSGDYAVFDNDKNTLATILDGKVDFSKISKPAAASSFLQDRVAIALPKNQNFTIALSKESLLPTPLKVKIQHYNAEGSFIGESEEKTLYPNINKIYTFNSNSITTDMSENELKVSFKKEKGKNCKIIKQYGDLKNDSKIRVMGEFSAVTSGTVNAGINFGSSQLYASLLFGFNTVKIGRSLELSPGIGKQFTLIDRILMDVEGFSNIFYAISSEIGDDEKRLNIVPSTRISLSFKPVHRISFFCALNLNLHITDFNDLAFDDSYRIKMTQEVRTAPKVKLVPNFSFGIKF
ncbi:lipase family protein [Treponema pectinovorum]|uniref:lipase family protein n=1 Tax=Treponema pectinovorum TaxID=164 RepID=UPI003D94EEBD